MHYHRSEHWIVAKGIAKVKIGEKEFLLKNGESTYVPAGVKHELENPGLLPLEIIELPKNINLYDTVPKMNVHIMLQQNMNGLSLDYVGKHVIEKIIIPLNF